MADVTTFKLGGANGDELAFGHDSVRTFRHVIDIEKAIEAGYTVGSSYAIMTLPKNTIVFAVDAVITQAIVSTGTLNTDIGTTKADPDEYVDAQTDASVGRFTSYVAAATAPHVMTADATLYAEFNATTLTSGKVAVTVVATTPASQDKELARTRTYPNA